MAAASGLLALLAAAIVLSPRMGISMMDAIGPFMWACFLSLLIGNVLNSMPARVKT